MDNIILPLCDEPDVVVSLGVAVPMGMPVGISIEDSPTIGNA